MADSYLTIVAPAEGQYREKGSKFISFAFPVQEMADIERHLAALKKQYFDARHHCYAWMVGIKTPSFRAYDDGEPSHSAGDPILGQIRAKGLTNVLVVVVRYFGGVKLGVGGLMAAYKTAAKHALEKALIVEEEVRVRYALRYPYEDTAEVMRLIASLQADVVRQQFLVECEIEIRIRIDDKTLLEDTINILRSTNHQVTCRSLNDTEIG
jgi:uncharacterized YigZ family protein